MIPISFPVESSGNLSPEESIIAVVTSLLLVQYFLFAAFLVEGTYFDNKLHALAWLIPGWPLVEMVYKCICAFWDL